MAIDKGVPITEENIPQDRQYLKEGNYGHAGRTGQRGGSAPGQGTRHVGPSGWFNHPEGVKVKGLNEMDNVRAHRQLSQNFLDKLNAKNGSDYKTTHLYRTPETSSVQKSSDGNFRPHTEGGHLKGWATNSQGHQINLYYKPSAQRWEKGQAEYTKK